MLKVKAYKNGFGITDGKKWFASYYQSKDIAQKVMSNINNQPDHIVGMNVSRAEPIDGPIAGKLLLAGS